MEEEKENYSLQTEPTWEHKALSGTDSILYARCKSILWEAPEKGAYHQRRDSSKRIEPGKVHFVFNRQPDAFRSGRAHQWPSGDLNGENFSAHNHRRKTTNIVVFISDMGWNSHLIPPGSGKGLVLPGGFCLKGIIFFFFSCLSFFLFFYSWVNSF